MNSWKRKWRKIIVAIIVLVAIMFVVGMCCIPFVWNERFFGTETTIAETLKYVGTLIGSILLAVNAFFIYRRVEEQSRSNSLVAKGQLDTRFKDAAMLLAAGNTSAELSAIHALHQIAVEASKTKDQKDYVGVIKDILIAFIKENSVIEYKKDEEEEKWPEDVRVQTVKKTYNKKSQIVLQTIIDKLFRDNVWEIYAEYPTILSRTVLKRIDFSDAQLQNVNFREAQLQNANFDDAQLQGAIFWNAQLQETSFWGAKLQSVDFNNAQLQYAHFDEDAQLLNANFRNTFSEQQHLGTK